MNILDYMNNISTQIYSRGEVIFKEGEQPDGNMYFIFQGLFAVTKKNPDGMVEIIKELGPGDFFGELALLSKKPRAMSVSVISSKARCGVLREEVLTKLSNVHSEFMFIMLKSAVQMLHRAEARLSHIDSEIESLKKVLDGK